MKKTIKTLFIAIFGLFAAIALAIVIAPTFFKDGLVKAVKMEINKQVEGEVDFSDIDVTWWSTFPDVALSLNDLRISGLKADSSHQDLFFAKELALGLDFMSVWTQGDSLEIKSFQLVDPDIYVFVDKTGLANYDLVKKTESTTESTGSAMKFDLSDYKISNANIRYIDVAGGMDISLREVDHTGALTYQADNLIWDAELISSNFTYKQQGVPYLNQAKINFDGKLNFDLANKKYSFLENDLMVNALELFFEGDVIQKENDFEIDVNVKSRKNTFKSILSVLPNMYASDFNKIDTKGNLEFQGSIKGLYSDEKNIYPIYDFKIKVDNGWFQIPGKTLAIEDIFIDSRLQNTNRTFEPTDINIPIFAFTLNNEKVTGNLGITNQSNNQFFDGSLKGKLNLGDVQASYPMPAVSELSGTLDLDATFKGNTKAIAANDMSQLQYGGFINGQRVMAKLDGQPKINLTNFSSVIKDDQLVITDVKGGIGSSDFEGKGNMTPISTLLTDNNLPLSLTMDIRGNQLNVDELMGSETSSASSAAETSSDNPLLRTMKFDITAGYKNIQYEDYKLENINAKVDGSLDKLNIRSFNGDVNNDPVQASGTFENIYTYTYQNGTMAGNLQVKSNSFNVDNWMTDDENDATNSSTETSYAIIPDRMNLTIDVDADKLTYDNIDIRQARGKLLVKDQRVSFDGMQGKTLGGQFGLDGYYAYNGKGEPLFKLAYDISNFSFEQTFQKVEMAKVLLPIIQFIQGTFNSNMAFEGSLRPGYMPDLSSLDGQGLLETLHGNLLNNPTLNKISNLVNLDDLKQLTFDKSRNKFSVQNGELRIEPFDKTVNDINALISGSHKLNGDMNYKMALTIPTEKFNVKGFPINIKEQFNSVQKQLNKLGLPLEETKSIRVDVLITGSLTDPEIGVKLVDFSKQSAKDAVKDAANNLANQAKDSVSNVAKSKVIDLVQGNKKDSMQTDVKEAVKIRVKDEVNTKIEQELTPVKDTLMNKAKDELKDKVKDEVLDQVDDDVKDKANEVLDNLNPFKKKKKKD
jgi:hypothetical protein